MTQDKYKFNKTNERIGCIYKFIGNLYKILGKNVENEKIKVLKRRRLVKVKSLKPLVVKKGSNFKVKLEKQETELTSEMIADGSWQMKKFKPLNYDARPRQTPKGAFHPLLKVR